MDNPTVAIVQARMGSTRLPGKVMKNLSGKPVLWHVVDRLRRSKNLNDIVIATTVLPEDNRIVDCCAQWGVRWYRGSSEDVLSRYYEASMLYKAATVVRITSDCPVIDPEIVDAMIGQYQAANCEGPAVDYLSNSLKRTFPRGLDAEVFSHRALEEAWRHGVKPYEREHVTPYIYQHPGLFECRNFESEEDNSGYRWTLDTEEDYRLLCEIFKRLYREGSVFGYREILVLMKDFPELPLINAHVQQKGY